MKDSRGEARRWLKQAQADLAVVATLRAAGHHAPACFYGQQSAEKALKAVLYGAGARAVLGHSLQDLARQCEALDASFAAMAEQARLLDQYYISARYPNGLPAPAIPSETYTPGQSQAGELAAREFVGMAERFLGSAGTG